MPYPTPLPAASRVPGQTVRTYRCQCNNPIFFRNSVCLTCGTPLGYHPEQARLRPLKPGPSTDTWTLWEDDGQIYRRCANLDTPAGCNWLLPANEDSAQQGLCRACRRPLSDTDRASPLYEHGTRCPHCADEYTDADRARFRERQHQMDLAAARGQRHLGGPD